jgi:phosphoenolpyruvate synthase/pyruvate phosphate dikinase
VILWLGDPEASDPAVAGGKAAALSRLACSFRIPPGFVVAGEPTDADVLEAYLRLGEPSVAVRSSAVDEDGVDHSFAGVHETFLNLTCAEAIVDAIRRCREAGGSDRALDYRRTRGLAASAEVAVLVQELVNAEVSAVAFTANPVTGSRDEVVVNAHYGLGEALVGGLATPDEIIVSKSDLRVLAYRIGSKETMTVATPTGTRELPVPALMRNRKAISDEQAAEIARLALSLEEEAGRAVDVECCYREGHLYLLQSRPVTTIQKGVQ